MPQIRIYLGYLIPLGSTWTIALAEEERLMFACIVSAARMLRHQLRNSMKSLHGRVRGSLISPYSKSYKLNVTFSGRV